MTPPELVRSQEHFAEPRSRGGNGSSARDTVTVFLVGAVAALVVALCFAVFLLWEKAEVLDLKIQKLSTQYEILKDRTERSPKEAP